MTRPGAKHVGPRELRLPDTFSRRIARYLWRDLEPFINRQEPEVAGLRPLGAGPMRLRERTRNTLQDLMDGRLTFDAALAAPLFIDVRGKRWGLRFVDPQRAGAKNLKRLSEHCNFLLGLVALPAVRRLLKRCGMCRAFILAHAVRPQKKTKSRRDFCSDACRRRATRKENARRLREFRHRERERLVGP